MFHFTNKWVLLLSVLLIASCSSNQNLVVPFNHPNLEYSGRIDTSSNQFAELYWSGSSIRLNFEGQNISAMFDEERADNYYNVIIDNQIPFILRPDSIGKYYELANGLSDGPHQIEIFKRTEWDRGWSRFYGFRIGGKAKLLPKNDPKKRKIEFYGNSITAGYAVEDFSGADRPDSVFTNNYLSYSSLAAKYFDAEYRCICKSGIGITVSWFPLIMPEIYNRLNPADPDSHWDFSLYSPDIVVINLFQNDSWLVDMPDHQEFKNRFGMEKPSKEFMIERYADFVLSIRKEYPEAEIICMLGNMDASRDGSPWPGYIDKAVTKLNDTKIRTYFEPYKNTPGHPTIAEQKRMAENLIRFIESNIEW